MVVVSLLVVYVASVDMGVVVCGGFVVAIDVVGDVYDGGVRISDVVVVDGVVTVCFGDGSVRVVNDLVVDVSSYVADCCVVVIGGTRDIVAFWCCWYCHVCRRPVL